jgi:hypothetical protein
MNGGICERNFRSDFKKFSSRGNAPPRMNPTGNASRDAIAKPIKILFKLTEASTNNWTNVSFWASAIMTEKGGTKCGFAQPTLGATSQSTKKAIII